MMCKLNLRMDKGGHYDFFFFFFLGGESIMMLK